MNRREALTPGEIVRRRSGRAKKARTSSAESPSIRGASRATWSISRRRLRWKKTGFTRSGISSGGGGGKAVVRFLILIPAAPPLRHPAAD